MNDIVMPAVPAAVRAAVEVEAVCLKCDKRFVLAEPAGGLAGERVAASP
jgi:hypothetical protein